MYLLLAVVFLVLAMLSWLANQILHVNGVEFFYHLFLVCFLATFVIGGLRRALRPKR